MLKKIFADKTRLLSSIIIVLVIVPAFVVTKYAFEPGRIIGLIIYLSLAMLALFEVFKAVGVNKNLAIIMSMVVIPFVLINWNPFIDFITGDRANESASSMLKSALYDWRSYLIIIAVSFVSLIDDKFRKQKGIFIRQFIVLFTVLVTAIFVKSIWFLNMQSLWKVMFFAGIAIIADTMAYVGGMLFGKKWFNGRKFSPRLSPKKTMAGFVVGVSSAMVFAILVGYFGGIWSDFGGKREIVAAVLAGAFLALIAPYGDLAFSAIKRFVGIKDFSNIIPGHGGLYDRIDALSIVFVFGSIIYLFV